MKPKDQWVIWILITIVIALSGWTLKKVHTMAVEQAKIEQDEEWIKLILIEQSRKK